MTALSAPDLLQSRKSYRAPDRPAALLLDLEAPLRQASDRPAPSIIAQLGWRAGVRVALARLGATSLGGTGAGSLTAGNGPPSYRFQLRIPVQRAAGRRIQVGLLALLLNVLGACHAKGPTDVSGPEMTLQTELGTLRVVAADCAPDMSQLHGGLDADAHSGPLTAQSCLQIAMQQCHQPASTFANALVGYSIVLGNGGSWIGWNQLSINCQQQQAAVRHEACHAVRRQFSCVSDPDHW